MLRSSGLWLCVVLTSCTAHPGDAEVARDVQKDKEKKCKNNPKKECNSATAVVGATGGTITAPSGLAIEIPPGAVDGATTISVTTSDELPPSELGAVSPVYEFGPDGLVFSRPVKVTLPLPVGVSDASVYWSKLGEPGYDAIGGTIVDDTIVAETVHFSTGVIGQKSATRTVFGVGKTTWISATTRVSEPHDFTAIPVEALVSDGNGGYTSIAGIPGTGAAAGTFTIPNVPTGEYILHSGTTYLVTSSNAPDLGRNAGGRPMSTRTLLEEDALLHLDVTGLAPWQPTDWLELFSTEADNWDFEMQRWESANGFIADGATSATFDMNMLHIHTLPSWIDSATDRAFLAQLTTKTSGNGTPYISMSRIAQLPAFSLPPDASLTVALQDLGNANTLALDYRGTEIVQELRADSHPGATYVCNGLQCGGFISALAQAGLAEDGFYTANADLLVLTDSDENGTNMLTGPMTYATPGATGGLAGTWSTIFLMRWNAPVFLQLPGTAARRGFGRFGFGNALEWVTTTTAAQAGAVRPILTQPTNVRVNGLSFFAGGTSIGASTTLTWDPPRIGTATYYSVSAVELSVDAQAHSRGDRRVHAITTSTSFTFPPGSLDPSKTYVFMLEAVTSTSATSALALATAPFRTTVELATANVSSGIFGTARGPLWDVTTVQNNLSFPIGITSTASSVYWTERFDSPWEEPRVCTNQGQIWTANLDGTGSQTVVSGLAAPIAVTTHGSDIYWLADNTGPDGAVERLHDGVVERLSDEPWLSTGLLSVGDHVYWLSGFGLRALDTTTMVITTLSPEGGINLATDGTNLYWTQYGTFPGATGRVLAMPRTGGTLTVLVDNQPQAWDVHTDGTSVYWSNQAWEQDGEATINSVTSTTTTTLTTGDQIMKVFAIDGTHAYFVNHGNLFRVALAGGARERIANLPNGGCPEGNMVVQDGSVYFTDVCAGAVYKVTPP